MILNKVLDDARSNLNVQRIIVLFVWQKSLEFQASSSEAAIVGFEERRRSPLVGLSEVDKVCTSASDLISLECCQKTIQI